jgi:hypothetical protein
LKCKVGIFDSQEDVVVESPVRKVCGWSEVWLEVEKMRKRNLAIQGNKKTEIKVK